MGLPFLLPILHQSTSIKTPHAPLPHPPPPLCVNCAPPCITSSSSYRPPLHAALNYKLRLKTRTLAEALPKPPRSPSLTPSIHLTSKTHLPSAFHTFSLTALTECCAKASALKRTKNGRCRDQSRPCTARIIPKRLSYFTQSSTSSSARLL